jgi:hypothetical protein
MAYLGLAFYSKKERCSPIRFDTEHLALAVNRNVQ